MIFAQYRNDGLIAVKWADLFQSSDWIFDLEWKTFIQSRPTEGEEGQSLPYNEISKAINYSFNTEGVEEI